MSQNAVWTSGSNAAKWTPVLNAAAERYGVPHNLAARQVL
jgi:hypothetical protein